MLQQHIIQEFRYIKTVDDALRANIKYRLLSEIKRDVALNISLEEKSQKQAAIDEIVDSVIVPTTSLSDFELMDEEVVEETPVVVEEVVEDTPVEEKTVISKKDIYETSSTYTSKIESSLEAQQNRINDYAPKRDYKKDRFEKVKDKEQIQFPKK